MKKRVYQGTAETKQRIYQAINDLAKITQVTLGPGGKPILLAQENRPPMITKDGVTVARHFEGDGDIEKIVAQAALEICERTVRQVGDGTTSSVILGAALVNAGQQWLNLNPECSPQLLSRNLKDIYQDVILPKITTMAKPIRNLPMEEAKSAVHYVALVSSNHDKEIADAVAEAVAHVGEDGMCIAEEGAGNETRVVPTMGFSFNSGLTDLGGAASSSFVNRSDYGDCVVEGAYVALYDGEINDVSTISPLLERVASEIDGPTGRRIVSPIVVFAHRFSDQVLKMMAQNFRRGVLTVVPVITPRNGQADGRQQFLHDLAAYVDGVVLDSQGSPLPEAQLAHLGFAESIKINRSEGVVLGKPEQSTIETRIADLKKMMDGASEFDCDLIRYRIGRLTGGVATVYAGGNSALEAKERHARVVDAISAVRAAMDMGVVPGGGVCLYVIAKELEKEYPKGSPVEIFISALQRPFLQILENVGRINIDLEQIGHKEDGFYVYDALEQKFVEWWAGGIMDPTKVTTSALENALSVSQLLMTCGGVITFDEDPESAKIRAMQEGVLKAVEGDM